MIRTEENQVAFTSKKRFSMRRTLTWTERFIVFFVLAGIASVLTLTLGRKAGYGWVHPFCMSYALCVGLMMPFLPVTKRVRANIRMDAVAECHEDGLYVFFRTADPEQAEKYPFIRSYEETVAFPWAELVEYTRTESGIPLIGHAMTECRLEGRRACQTGLRCIELPDNGRIWDGLLKYAPEARQKEDAA